MSIEVSIDMKSFSNIIGQWKSDLNYITSRAMNDTLKDAQKEMKGAINERFKVRRPQFVDKSVKISKFTNKTDLTGVVGIENLGGKSTADILSKFEDGGVKKGRGDVAVPSTFIKPDFGRIIPSNKRPRNLRNALKVKTKDGKELLLVKTGRGKNRRTDVAYFLVPQVKIDNRLHFVDQVTKSININYNKNFDKRFAEVREKFQ